MAKRRFTKAPANQDYPNKGEWCWITIHSKPPKREVAIGCPECGCHAGLQHKIDDQGVVTPSLVCPHDPCTFHEWGILEGWGSAEVPPGQDPDEPGFKP